MRLVYRASEEKERAEAQSTLRRMRGDADPSSISRLRQVSLSVEEEESTENPEWLDALASLEYVGIL